MKKSLLSPIISGLEAIKTVMSKNAPGLLVGRFTGDYERHQSMRKTIAEITDAEKYQQLQQSAHDNLSRWQSERVESPLKVDVEELDWGVAALSATKKYGESYAILNMANSEFPGGLAFEGGSAQEENIWHRTTCALSLLDSGVYLDKENHVYRYNEAASDLVSGRVKLSTEELQRLNELRHQRLVEANKVYFNQCPQICFRGPEFLVDQGVDFGKNSFFAEPSLSFHSLSPKLIFPFYELRSAAPDLSGQKINWQDAIFIEKYTKKVRKQIAAQLDTLILAGVPNVILGAWGCGAFKNNPDIISKLYREEIEKRCEHFQHIIFSIMNTRDYSGKFGLFQKQLHGLKLAYSPGKTAVITSVESVKENFALSPMSIFDEPILSESKVSTKA